EETEDFLDKKFNNPLGFLWAKLFIKLGVSPNAITVLSMVIGVAGALLFYPDSFIHNLAGIILITFTTILDATDGQVARLTGKTSELGRILDGVATGVWTAVAYIVLAIRLTGENIPFTNVKWGVFIWIAAVVSGLFGNNLQCLLADRFRNTHTYFQGVKACSLDSSDEVAAELAGAKSTAQKLYLRFYLNYTKNQERLTPSFCRLFRETKEHGISEELSFDYLKVSRRLVPLANIFTINTRLITLFVCVLAGVPYLYFFIEFFLLGALMLFTRAKYESLARELSLNYFRDNGGAK
ncbi:MAG: CDP-alcohol phosphatidyltransferase family protein, partial [Clostridia bacterium]|nr:CDP-alcohol phosphatidyltransferase family protein [Clostridia bacterium]